MFLVILLTLLLISEYIGVRLLPDRPSYGVSGKISVQENVDKSLY